MELRRRFGGPPFDPEAIPPTPALRSQASRNPNARSAATERADDPSRTQPAAPSPPEHRLQEPPATTRLDLGDGVSMRLVRIPAGRLTPPRAEPGGDRRATEVVSIDEPFWIGAYETTNRQFRQFDPAHRSGYYAKRRRDTHDCGLPMDEPDQPVVRVSWRSASAFCAWLSHRSGWRIRLPSSVEWEYACRAGSSSPLYFGATETDFAKWANLADASFSRGLMSVRPGGMQPDGVTQITGGVPHLLLEGAALSCRRFNDGAIVTAAVGGYRPNRFGLFDMHGNAAEWTGTPRSGDADSAVDPAAPGRGERMIVRGGSFFDRPERAANDALQDYHAWQRVFNVGFRIVATTPPKEKQRAQGD
jgi:formylglycine-generating enzyme required for sulfatase activity